MPLVKKTMPGAAAAEVADWQTQLALLQSGTAEQRWSAARALATQPEAATALGEALSPQMDAALREAIFTSLAKLDSPASFNAALRHLRADDAQLRTGAFDALALMPVILAQRLDALLHDDDPDIRILACDLARYIPAQQAAFALANILATDEAVNVCAAAIDALATTGGLAQLPELEACAGRFPAEYFLSFSIKMATDQIRSRSLV